MENIIENRKQHNLYILVEKLKQLQILKYGNFVLKSGLTSNYYCDFRTLISYPNILKTIYNLINPSFFDDVDIVSGVFFGGIPLANLISFERNIPQIFIRDNEKSYGTKKQIEGDFKEGQTVLLIEDVITTGKSIMEKINVLKKYGLKIKILTILKRDETLDHLDNTIIHSIIPLHFIVNHEVEHLNKIYNIAFKKKSNIILSVDLNNSKDIIDLIEETKDNIIGIKIHSDIIEDFHLLLKYLNNIKDDFIIIEDCKVADITYISVQKVKTYTNYADYITYHCLLGEDLPKTLKSKYTSLGLIGVVEMSIKNSLINEYYIENTNRQFDIMDGCVIQKKGLQLFKNKLPITFSPGISIDTNKDDYNQLYRDPLKEHLGEFWIIGRSIYLDDNRKDKSEKYKNIGWKHFINFNI